MLHVASVCTPCCMLLDVVAQSLKPVRLFSQQLPTFLLFCDRRSVVQQCWIRLHSSFNIVGATHAHYAWFAKTTMHWLLGVVASVSTPLPTRTQQLPTTCPKEREILCLNSSFTEFSRLFRPFWSLNLLQTARESFPLDLPLFHGFVVRLFWKDRSLKVMRVGQSRTLHFTRFYCFDFLWTLWRGIRWE